MNRLQGPGTLLVTLAVAAVLLVNDLPLACFLLLAAALVTQSLRERRTLDQLSRWSRDPDHAPLDTAHPRWSQVFERIARTARQRASLLQANDRERERLHAAVDLMPDGLIVMDIANTVQWYNESARHVHNLTPTRRPIDHFIRQPEFTRYLAQEYPLGSVIVTLPQHPGRTFLLRLVVAPDGWRLLITRDVTEQHKIDAMRRDFVANVSHEVRTPLTVIFGYLDTLLELDEIDADARRCYLREARKQAATMQRLLADLLTLSSLEQDLPDTPDEEFCVRDMMESLVHDTRRLSAGAHHIELVHADPVDLFGSPTEIESAVSNLLTNAVRYTPKGGSIRISWQHHDGTAILAVDDTGIGIAPAHLPRLTERFYRVDRSRSRETGGTGLGLAIVKHIAHRHGATLAISSTLGKGSRFSLTFPESRLRPQPAQETGTATADAPRQDTPPDALPPAPASSAGT